jgi:hypothetical protein
LVCKFVAKSFAALKICRLRISSGISPKSLMVRLLCCFPPSSAELTFCLGLACRRKKVIAQIVKLSRLRWARQVCPLQRPPRQSHPCSIHLRIWRLRLSLCQQCLTCCNSIVDYSTKYLTTRLNCDFSNFLASSSSQANKLTFIIVSICGNQAWHPTGTKEIDIIGSVRFSELFGGPSASYCRADVALPLSAIDVAQYLIFGTNEVEWDRTCSKVEVRQFGNILATMFSVCQSVFVVVVIIVSKLQSKPGGGTYIRCRNLERHFVSLILLVNCAECGFIHWILVLCGHVWTAFIISMCLLSVFFASSVCSRSDSERN